MRRVFAIAWVTTSFIGSVYLLSWLTNASGKLPLILPIALFGLLATMFFGSALIGSIARRVDKKHAALILFVQRFDVVRETYSYSDAIQKSESERQLVFNSARYTAGAACRIELYPALNRRAKTTARNYSSAGLKLQHV